MHAAMITQPLLCGRTREQSVVFALDDCVALAGARFQTCAIEDRDAPPGVLNETRFLQLERALGDAFAANAEHVGDKFLRHHQFGTLQPIQAQQKPAAQLLIEGMVPIAYCGLRHLRDEGLRVSQEQVKSRLSLVEFGFHEGRLQPTSEPRALHDRAAGRGFTAHEKRHTHDAFVSDDRNLRGGAIFHDVEQGDDCGDGKIDVVKRDARLVYHFTEWHIDALEQGCPTAPFLGRQCGQEMISPEVFVSVHGYLARERQQRVCHLDGRTPPTRCTRQGVMSDSARSLPRSARCRVVLALEEDCCGAIPRSARRAITSSSGSCLRAWRISIASVRRRAYGKMLGSVPPR